MENERKYKVLVDIYSESDYNNDAPWVNKGRICTLYTEAGIAPYCNNNAMSLHFSSKLQDWVYYVPNQFCTQDEAEEMVRYGWKFYETNVVGTHTVVQAFALRDANNAQRKIEHELLEAEQNRWMLILFYTIIALIAASALAWEAYKYLWRLQ